MSAKTIFDRVMKSANKAYYSAKVAKNRDLVYRAPELIQIESDQVKCVAMAFAEIIHEMGSTPNAVAIDHDRVTKIYPIGKTKKGKAKARK